MSSHRVVGWAVGTWLATALPLTVLQRAIAWRRPAAGLHNFTDRRSECASQDYRAALTTHGAVQNMSPRGDCWDNAVDESFFATLEHELLPMPGFRTHRDAERAIAAFIECWYNPMRRHSTLGNVSQLQNERQLLNAAKDAYPMCQFLWVNSAMVAMSVRLFLLRHAQHRPISAI